MPDNNGHPQESGNTAEQSSTKDESSGNPPAIGEFPVSEEEGGTPVIIDTTDVREGAWQGQE
ncbi:uncharacterized protein FFFS_15803 [Fusarium fujikuroi]|nr:uncharacterized protein FFFS_15803 [Fusarium fujikuroi]